MKLYIQSGYIETDLNISQAIMTRDISSHLKRVADKEKEAIENIQDTGERAKKDSIKIKSDTISEISQKEKDLFYKIESLEKNILKMGENIKILSIKESEITKSIKDKVLGIEVDLINKLTKSLSAIISSIENKSIESINQQVNAIVSEVASKLSSIKKETITIIEKPIIVKKEIEHETGREVFVDGKPFKSHKDIESLKHSGNPEELI